MTLSAGSEQTPHCVLKCFGVGDGWPSPDRDHSSFLYRFRDQSLLIDCGEPVSRKFKASGLNYNLIDHIFISHLHFDHVGGFFMLMQGFWLEGRTKPLIVHAPADGIPPIRQLLQAGCIFDELLQFAVHYEPLSAGLSLELGALRVTPFPTTHLASLQQSFETKYSQKFEAFSFLMETEQLRIAHSADIGSPDDLAPLLEKPLDALVCELAHVAPKELFQVLRGRAIGRIVFTHLSRAYLEMFKEVKTLAEKMLGSERLIWPTDGFELDLVRKPT